MTFQYCFDGSIKKVNNLSVSSPRTWGCFHFKSFTCFSVFVFPTHVGVFLRKWSLRRPSSSLPHARGGVSVVSQGRDERHQSSPRTWGCFSLRCSRRVRCFVFPTHVGVFLFIIARAFPSLGLPHARGGVSRTEDGMAGGFSSSPRTWGCFHLPRLLPGPSLVFPTHVGVFLAQFPCC